MTSRAVLQVFEDYQASRTKFVQTVAELAIRPQNIESLQNAGVIQLLRPLLLDTVPSIQQSAALALGRLASYSEELAECVVSSEVLPQLIYSLSEQNRYYKKAASFVLRSISKHSAELAQCVVDAGALESLVECLSEFEPSVKEGAVWTLAYISRHNETLAQSVVDTNNSINQIILCLQEPELSLKRISASALSEIAKHNISLAQNIVDCGGINYLVPLIQHPDNKLVRQVCSALAQIAKHSVDLAENIVECEIFPKILSLLKKDKDLIVKKNAATLIREIVKHTPELARLVVNCGGDSVIIEYITETCGNIRLPGIMTLGYIGAFSDTLALAIIVHQGILPLKDSLINESEDYIRAASAWSLGQIGRHTPDHSKALAQADIFSKLINVYKDNKSSVDLKNKSQRALKAVLSKCTHLIALQPLLINFSNNDLNCKILKYIIQQFAKVLPNDTTNKKSFVQSGALQKIQELKYEYEQNNNKSQDNNQEQDENDNNQENIDYSDMLQYINTINSCFPPELVQYYSPNYSKQLLSKLDDFD
eukprot:467348_1